MLSIFHFEGEHDLFEVFKVPVSVHAVKLVVKVLWVNLEVLL